MISVPDGVAALPQGSLRSRESVQPASLLDIYPTLIELCGLPRKPELDGVSLAPLLSRPGLDTGRAIVTTNGRANHAVRDKRWRYIQYADGSEELYDHDTDPNEWANLALLPGYEETISRLKYWLPRANAPDSPKDPNR